MKGMPATPTGSSFLTHAPEAVNRLARAFPEDPQGAVDRAEKESGMQVLAQLIVQACGADAQRAGRLAPQRARG